MEEDYLRSLIVNKEIKFPSSLNCSKKSKKKKKNGLIPATQTVMNAFLILTKICIQCGSNLH